jgi:hypothetical protein
MCCSFYCVQFDTSLVEFDQEITIFFSSGKFGKVGVHLVDVIKVTKYDQKNMATGDI